jgi:hypothetical protein
MTKRRQFSSSENDHEALVRCPNCGVFSRITTPDFHNGNYKCPCEGGEMPPIKIVLCDFKKRSNYIGNDAYACPCEAMEEAMSMWNAWVATDQTNDKKQEIGVVYDFLG